MKRSLFSILALILLIACQEVELVPDKEFNGNIYASIEQVSATKTSMDAYGNVRWSSGDQIAAFIQSTYARKYQILSDYVGETTGGFSEVSEGTDGIILSGNHQDHNILFYPYSSSVKCGKYNLVDQTQYYKLEVTLPSIQHYSEDTFGNGSFPMVAVAAKDDIFTFKNICGGISLQFKGVDRIKSIKLEGCADEKLSGEASVFANAKGTPSIEMSSTAATSVTLNCGEAGVQLNETTPTTFIITIPPVAFASGMKVTVTDTDGLSKTLTNSSSNIVTRSNLLVFQPINYKQEDVLRIQEGTSYDISAEGGDIVIPVITNLNHYDVVIPEEAQEWVHVVESKALREETITLRIAENTASSIRTAIVKVYDEEITIRQEAALEPLEIRYTTSSGQIVNPSYLSDFKNVIISNTYENGVGVMKIKGTVTEIPESAFESVYDLTSISIPHGITRIGKCAFRNCIYITHVDLPDDLITIDERAFIYCSFEEIDIPDSVEEIGSQAFDSTDLKSCTIPDNVKTLGKQAFCWCSSLESVVIGKSVKELQDQTFELCENLKTVIISDSVEKIGTCVFSDCNSMERIVVGRGVREIADNAFYDTGGVLEFLGDVPSHNISYYSYFTELIFGDDVTEIGDCRFSYLPYLENVTIGTGLKSVNATFPNTVKRVDIKDLRAWYDIKFNNDAANPLYGNGYLYLNNNIVSSLTVPSDVTVIGDYQFQGCVNIVSVVMHENVSRIGVSAFKSCSNLNNVVMGSNVGVIDRNAFSNCTRLPSITLPSKLTVIGSGAFYKCTSLSNDVIIPDTVTDLGESAFYNCSRIAKLKIGNGVSKIHNYTFWKCSALRTIDLGNNISGIGSYAFEECSSIESVTIPGSVKTIGECAFRNCRSVSDIKISEGVETIWEESFYNCNLVTHITIPESVTKIGYEAFDIDNLSEVIVKPVTPPTRVTYRDDGETYWGAFGYDQTNMLIYVPTESVSSYKSQWAEYKNVITSL